MEDNISGGKIAQTAKRRFKLCVFGESRSGKTLLVDFLKNEKLTQSCESGNDQLFTTGSATEEQTNLYTPSWGLKCFEVEQEITESVIACMEVWEAGSLFISKFPHYLEYLAQEADLVVYTVSIDMESDASNRSVNDFLNGLRQTVNLARQAFEEQYASSSSVNAKDKPKPKEVIVITGSEKYQSHSQEQIQQVHAFAQSEGIPNCKTLEIPSRVDLLLEEGDEPTVQ